MIVHIFSEIFARGDPVGLVIHHDLYWKHWKNIWKHGSYIMIAKKNPMFP